MTTTTGKLKQMRGFEPGSRSGDLFRRKQQEIAGRGRKVCSICFLAYEGHGNNAAPINDGRCCDHCNSLVVMRRF